MADLTALVTLLRLAMKDRTQLVLENIVHRHERQPLDGESPDERKIESVGVVAAHPVLGGLHNRYSRAA